MENIDLIEKALRNLDHEFKYDEDGDIVFENDIGSFILECEKGYLSITFPNFYEISSYSEKTSLLNIFNDIHSEYRAVKFFFIKSNACASIELFYGNESNFEDVITRSLKALHGALKYFAKEARKVLDLSEVE